MLQLSELAPEALWLPSTEGCFLILPFSISVLWLNLQMPPTLATSFFFPSNLPWAFPNCSAPHLCSPSSDPESTDLRNMACAELRELWGQPCPSNSAWGQRWMGEWCCGRNFYLQTSFFHPCITTPLSQALRMVDWQGLISDIAVWPKSSLAFWPILECFIVWELLLIVSPPGLPKA